jgi:methylenetetrahydrofolate reductase (NADPH)
MGLLDALQQGWFPVVLEFTPHSADDVRRAAAIAAELPALSERFAAQRLIFPAISLTQNPGGSLSYDPLGTLALLHANGLPDTIEVIPHVTGKDMNSDALTVLLRALADAGVGTVLALTGDLPSGRPVFDRDALGVLDLVRRINLDQLRAARSPEEMAAKPQLRAGAAVSPFKYTEGSLAMQYIKAAKKIRTGAEFLICQSGWDAERSERLLRTLAPERTPLFGNVLALDAAAAKHMRTLPGCVITEALLNRLGGEGEDDVFARAAQQLAMFRQLGYAGVDLGRPGDFRSVDDIVRIVEAALAISDWTAHRDNLTFAPPENPPPRMRTSTRVSRAMHNAVFEDDGALHGVARAVLGPVNRSADHEGALYRLFRCMEDFGKEALYKCERCGDCFLPENAYLCTLGSCEKGLPNVPCGDADPEGRCGNNPDRICVGEAIYWRLMKTDALEEFQRVVLPPRRAELRQTSSVLNRLFHRDHHAAAAAPEAGGLIQVAELIHASVPLAGAALRLMQARGADGFERPNRGRTVIEDLIATQAAEGGTYIDLNIDALGDADAPGFMRRMVELVRRHGGGVPPCIDSSAPAVLEAGLDAWLEGGASARPALVNSVTFSETERYAGLLARRARLPFSVVCLLVGKEGPLKSTEAMVEAARALFDRCRSAGFRAEEIFFDTVTLGIGTDGFMDGEGNLKSSHTRNSFDAIQKIRKDPTMRGVHAILGVSNWVYGARKRRIGHLRAFIQVAMEHGLDAIISDVSKNFGRQPAPAELVEFVRMFLSLDGSDESMDRYSDGMAAARERGWV